MYRIGYNRAGACVFRMLIATGIALFFVSCSPDPNRIQPVVHTKEIVANYPVFRGGSDFRSFCFKWWDLPGLIKMADKEYTKQAVLDHFERLKFDPARFKLMESSQVRVYFIGEGSGYIDSLCVNTEGVGFRDGVPKVLFPNSNTAVQLDGAARLIRKYWAFGQWDFGKRSDAAPVLPGDFVDLGKIEAGKTLSFFLLVNGTEAYTPVADENPDKKAHMVGMAIENTPYVLISYEDMAGLGDADFEDAVFAVEMSQGNVDALLGRFDPWGKAKRIARWAALLTFIFGTPPFLWAMHRRMLRGRWRRHCREAESFLAAGNSSDALTATRKAERNARIASEIGRCKELTAAASQACNDLASLIQLESEHPEIFQHNEAASLSIARAQIETGMIEAYGKMRRLWEQREQACSAWLGLDSDVMLLEGRHRDALELLQRKAFPGAEDAARLARLAALLASERPEEAEKMAAQAVRLNPESMDVPLFYAQVLESCGKVQPAYTVLMTALQKAPGDPIVRDRLADFYTRRGRFAQALAIWRQGLRPPSIDFIWVKFLFWTRVAEAVEVDWKTLESPPGLLKPLNEYLITLEADRFWHAGRFNKVEKDHPALANRPEAHWLCILEALRTGNEKEARWRIGFARCGREFWPMDLTMVLARILMYRQTGYLGPLPTSLKEAGAITWRHPLVDALEYYATGLEDELPAALAEFLQGPDTFAALFYAAGWKAAGKRLRPEIAENLENYPWERLFRMPTTKKIEHSLYRG